MNTITKPTKTKIDGYEMVKDLCDLLSMHKRDLPLHVNRNWHPEIHKMYGKMLSGGEPPYKIGAQEIPSITEYYIYELDPIDDWTGYAQVWLEDMLSVRKWLDLVEHAFKGLKLHSNWEGDIREGPYVAMIPGTEWFVSPFAVLLKQDNNGTTYCVSKQKLDHIQEYLIATAIF
jgi:hypothetical protein